MNQKAAALEKTHAALEGQHLDALVAASPWNVVYTSGTAFLTQRTIPDRLAMTVLSTRHDPLLIYCTIEEQQAKDESWLSEFRGYTEFADNPIDVLASVLVEQGLEKGRIGIEKRYLVSDFYERLMELMPGATFVSADSIFDKLRAIKTREEIDWLGKTALWTDAAIRTAFETATVGDTEVSVGQRMINEANKCGASGLLHLVLATGANGLQTHHAPNQTKLEPGDIVRTDFGMYWGHYVSDIARTAIVGPARDRQVEAYKKLEDIHQTVISAMVPGARCSDLYTLCASSFDAHSLPFAMPHIGHSIGLGVHDNPMLHPFDDTQLEPGMLFMLEPYVMTEFGAFHTEDMIEVTNSECRVLSRSADWSEPFIIN